MWFYSTVLFFSLFYRFWSHLFPFVIGECSRTVATCNDNSDDNGNDRIKQNKNHFDFFAVTLPFSANRVSFLKLNLLATRFHCVWNSRFLSFSTCGCAMHIFSLSLLTRLTERILQRCTTVSKAIATHTKIASHQERWD